MGTEALGDIVLLAFKRVIAVHIQFHYKLNPMLVNLVGIYSTLGGQKRVQSPIHWPDITRYKVINTKLIGWAPSPAHPRGVASVGPKP